MSKALIVSNLEKMFLPGHSSMIDPLKELGYGATWASNFSEYNGDLLKAPCITAQIDFVRSPYDCKNIIAFKQLMDLLVREDYDLIHCHTPIGGVLGRLCGKIAKVPKIIYTAHGFHFYRGAPLINRTIFKWAEMIMARFTDAIITINKEDYEAAKKFKLRDDGQVYYMPGVGIDTSLIKKAVSKRGELLKEISVDDSSVLLISVGELNKNKNHRIIIEAMGRLKNPSIHYILCGNGEEKGELEALANRLNIERRVHFFGFRSDIPELLNSCDIFVMPSYREGLSRSLMEAMSAGLPCIVSRIRGNTDLIENEKGGLLFEPNDINGFAYSINTLAFDKSLREKMGRNNSGASTMFDVANIKEQMKNIYFDILEI